MTKTGKLLVALVLCLSLFVGTGAAAGLNAVISNFKLFVNGERVDQAVVVIDGRSYLPVRAIGEALGAQVDFNAETGRIDVNTEAGSLKRQPARPQRTLELTRLRLVTLLPQSTKTSSMGKQQSR